MPRFFSRETLAAFVLAALTIFATSAPVFAVAVLNTANFPPDQGPLRQIQP